MGWKERGFDIPIPFEGAVNVQHRTLTVALAQLIVAHHGAVLPHHPPLHRFHVTWFGGLAEGGSTYPVEELMG